MRPGTIAKAFGGIGYCAPISSETNGNCTGRNIRSGLPSADWLFQKKVLPPRRVEREPYEAAEYPSRRCYLVARAV